jgi:hypothetical protein
MSFEEWWKQFLAENKVEIWYESEKFCAKSAWEAAKRDTATMKKGSKDIDIAFGLLGQYPELERAKIAKAKMMLETDDSDDYCKSLARDGHNDWRLDPESGECVRGGDE